MIPHKNGLTVELAGVTSGHLGNAQLFAEKHGVTGGLRIAPSHAGRGAAGTLTALPAQITPTRSMWPRRRKRALA